MLHIPITLTENNSHIRKNEPVEVSIPFENGKVFDINSLCLLDDKLQIICQMKPMNYWPNGSIKWLRLAFQVSIDSNSSKTLHLSNKKLDNKCKNKISQILCEDFSEYFEIKTGSQSFRLNKYTFGVFDVQPQDCFLTNEKSIQITDITGNTFSPKITTINSMCSLDNTDLLSLPFQIEGELFNPNVRSPIQFTAKVTFYANKSYTKWQFTLHNPQAMVHHNGKWDLGNEHSCYFNAVEVIIPIGLSSTKISISPTKNDVFFETLTDDFLIFQGSSGGEHWQSNNHINHLKHNPIKLNGYRFYLNTPENPVETIARAEPIIQVGITDDTNKRIAIYIDNFWQKFPKSLEFKNQNVVLGLFSKHFSEHLELQPGEKKSDTFYIDYKSEQKPLIAFTSPIEISLNTDYLITTNTIPFLADSSSETEYNNIINDGLLSKNNFFQKREQIDEFGWRNFGDLYADHETLEIENRNDFISHYNNQYDPLYGFLRQYLLTKNNKWLELANDLADHVKNIDTYHTTKDKNEYNGGLFWHTDHYLPAETASHRTYSKHQSSNAYQDHAGGGGPGGQHCYTTGLMLHYFITDDETSKQAVLQLTKWITCVYEGSGTITDLLLAIKNKHRIDIKNIFTGKYPLDRGTGHYLIALIDAHEVTGQQSYLDDASLIIKNTIHPDDDVNSRNLSNVEECWFYTVFLQSVVRYLLTKESLNQLDNSFLYARSALLHYARWMEANEQPYLNKPEILEYPNHTWAAQDIRKANVLFLASYFTNKQQEKQSFYKKGDTIYQYVIEILSVEPTRYFTRILSILMQNHGVKSFVEEKGHSWKLNNVIFPKKNITTKKILFDTIQTVLQNTSIDNELNWLRKRILKVDNILLKLGK